MKASVYIATSLDGFIARTNGDVDWLGGPAEDGEDFGFARFFDSVDALVMGRNTFEMVQSFGEWPYGSKPVFVLTSRTLELPGNVAKHVEPMSCSPEELVERLSKKGMKRIYVDGGKTIQGFLEAGLIQHIVITRIPILIGKGIPLFGPLKQDVKLRHIETKVFPNGLEQSEYEVAA
jgi:dihydrofolate reductase